MGISKWLHFEELGGDPWALPIYSKINSYISDEIRELGMYVYLRLNILPRVVNRLNQNIQKLYTQIKGRSSKYIFTPENLDACGFKIDDNNLYELIADIDSFLFEFDSVCELMRKFFVSIYRISGKEINNKFANQEISKLIGVNSSDSHWFNDLTAFRNFFTHNAAPYIAVDISDENKPELIILKRNVKDLSSQNQDDYFRLSEFQNIANGFLTAKQKIQQHLIGLFN